MTVTYRFQHGETIVLALDAVDGDIGIVDAITAKLKRAMGGAQEAAFTVTPRAAAGGVPAGWDLTIDAPTSAALPPSIYVADARLEIGDAVIVTDPVRVQIVSAASAP